jgi:hypothetical protein
MIFIGLFLFITIVVISLNMYNHSNLSYIKDYLQKSNCEEYIYSKGSYKAFCGDSFIEIKNSFIVNIDENSTIFKYKDINNLQINQLNLVINNTHKITFKEKKELDKFYKKISEKIKN